MRTPEAIEKDEVKAYLASIGAYQFWPVTGGWGLPALDCIACINGCYVGIEVKAPGGRYTARQNKIMDDIRKAGGGVFAGTADQIIRGLKAWLSVSRALVR